MEAGTCYGKVILNCSMAFPITIKHDGKLIRLAVEQVLLDNRNERYKVQAKNGHVIVESNRPFLRNRGLKHKPPDWKAVEAHNLSAYVLQKVYEAIMEQVDK
jgi:hypothetical protein